LHEFKLQCKTQSSGSHDW